MRDVASAVAGKENTVPAFGFAFYRCKNERRPNVNNPMNNFGSETIYTPSVKASVNTGSYNCFKRDLSIGDVKDFLSTELSYSITNISITNSRANEIREFRKTLIENNSYQDKGHIRTTCLNDEKAFSQENEMVQERLTKDVSVGAGARILQNIKLDTTPISEWGEKPETLITLYFVFEEQLETIIEKGGIRKLENNPEGYLENIPVG